MNLPHNLHIKHTHLQWLQQPQHCALPFHMLDDDDNSLIDSNPLHSRTRTILTYRTPNGLPPHQCRRRSSWRPLPNSSIMVMMFGWKNQFHTGTYASMNSHNQHDLCPYPCPYSSDQLYPTPEYVTTPQYMDLSDIFNFPDVMTTASQWKIYLVWKMFLNFKYWQ